jgi:hypothetical protein
MEYESPARLLERLDSLFRALVDESPAKDELYRLAAKVTQCSFTSSFTD